VARRRRGREGRKGGSDTGGGEEGALGASFLSSMVGKKF
jgi:hypothetical protein